MAEIAHDIINGSMCAICGQYFEDPENPDFIYSHDYPAACDECWDKDCGYEKAETNTF